MITAMLLEIQKRESPVKFPRIADLFLSSCLIIMVY